MTTFGYEYKDKHPFNIEAPQKLYIQYSQDIDFIYTGDNYPLGEEHEGFIWESIYNPVEHIVDSITLGRHVWMRVSIGDNAEWTLPIRITDSFTNIETTDISYDTSEGTATFRFKYVLEDGTIIYSDPITIQNGVDGRGITDTAIITDNLVITYSDGTIDDLGRVTGYDGTGVPFGSPNGWYLTNQSNVPTWTDPVDILNTNLTATLPLEFSNPNFTHSNLDGYRHVLAGGTAGDSLITTDGAGAYAWAAHILLADLDDTAGIGDTDKLYSADHISNLIAGLSLFGIKYSETTKVLLDLITGANDELGVVTADPLYPNRTVFKWSGGGGGNWGTGFFDLDATHNHDSLYTLTSDLVGDGLSSVHWNNITNAPLFMDDWTINGDSGTLVITDGDTLNIVGSNGISTTLVSDTLTINGYTAGVGLDLLGAEFSHENTSSLSSITYTGGIVLNGVTVDTFGHLQGLSTINLDSRFGEPLTPGAGLSGTVDPYTGGAASTFSVDFAGNGVADSAARSDHSHGGAINATTIDIGTWNMQSLPEKVVDISSLGITIGNIISITAYIFRDGITSGGHNLEASFIGTQASGDTGLFGGNVTVPLANNLVTLYRVIGGYFQSTSYNDTITNRGWLTILYT